LNLITNELIIKKSRVINDLLLDVQNFLFPLFLCHKISLNLEPQYVSWGDAFWQ
jgi:hypothetical protein